MVVVMVVVMVVMMVGDRKWAGNRFDMKAVNQMEVIVVVAMKVVVEVVVMKMI